MSASRNHRDVNCIRYAAGVADHFQTILKETYVRQTQCRSGSAESTHVHCLEPHPLDQFCAEGIVMPGADNM